MYEICTEFGLESNFEHELPIDISIFDSLMLSRTEKTWKDTIQFKPKLRTYVKYKIHYKTEDYIRMPLGRMHRAILAQFRSGILPFRIETGQGMLDVRRKYCWSLFHDKFRVRVKLFHEKIQALTRNLE